jgi:DNA-binding XRE family transcriptional regulator
LIKATIPKLKTAGATIPLNNAKKLPRHSTPAWIFLPVLPIAKNHIQELNNIKITNSKSKFFIISDCKIYYISIQLYSYVFNNRRKIAYTTFEVILMNELDPKLVGRVIAYYRKSRKLSQEVLSGLAGICRTHLSAIERGERKPHYGDFLQNLLRNEHENERRNL